MVNPMALWGRFFLGEAIAQVGAKEQNSLTVKPTDRQLRAFSYDHTVKVYVGDLSGRKVLDLGCNDGSSSRLLWELGAERVVGVDRYAHNVKKAKSLDSNVTYTVGDAVTGDFSKFGPFEVITGFLLTSCVKDVEKLGRLIGNVRRHLPVGGELFALIPNARTRAGEFTAPGSEPGTYFQTGLREAMEAQGLFSEERYSQLLTNAGFDRIRFYPSLVSIEGLLALGTKAWAKQIANPPYEMIYARAAEQEGN